MDIKIFNLNAIETNTYVLSDKNSKEAIIIDLGGDYKKVFEYIKNQGLDLKYILCTHGHFDHILGVSEMQADGINIPVYLSPNDDTFASNLSEKMKVYGFYGEYNPVRYEKFPENLLFNNKPVKIFETPGHTQGGVCFLIEDKLFSGDTLFEGSIGRCDLEGGNLHQLISSIKNNILSLNDDTVVYPGHGNSTSIAREKLINPYLK